jgi:hypothetical protein
MRISMMALVCVTAMFATEAYADDLLSSAYGNTVTTKSEKTGSTSKLLFNQDGTYTTAATDAKGQPVTFGGSWTSKDGTSVCLTPQLPAGSPGAGTTCSPLSKHAVGDSWTVTNDQGETFDVSIVAGR